MLFPVSCELEEADEEALSPRSRRCSSSEKTVKNDSVQESSCRFSSVDIDCTIS